MAEVKILNSFSATAQDPARAGKRDRVVLYQEVGGRAGMVRLPEEGFSEATLRAAIQKDLADAKALIGKSLTV